MAIDEKWKNFDKTLCNTEHREQEECMWIMGLHDTLIATYNIYEAYANGSYKYVNNDKCVAAFVTGEPAIMPPFLELGEEAALEWN
jgi:hypothetical protein